jgi:hypothetical protein
MSALCQERTLVSDRENGRSQLKGFSLLSPEGFAPRRTNRTLNKKFTPTSALAVRPWCFDRAPAQRCHGGHKRYNGGRHASRCLDLAECRVLRACR